MHGITIEGVSHLPKIHLCSPHLPFLSSENLCLIHYLKLYYDLTWPQRPTTEKVLKFNLTFHNSVNFFLSKHQHKEYISPKIIEFKNLEDSEVHSSSFLSIFSLIDISGLCNLTGLNSLNFFFSSPKIRVMREPSDLRIRKISRNKNRSFRN